MGAGFSWCEQRRRTPPRDQDRGIRPRRGSEAGCRQAHPISERPPGRGSEGKAPTRIPGREQARHAFTHHQIEALRTRSGIEQATQQPRRHPERRIRDDPVRLRREAHLERVAREDPHVAVATTPFFKTGRAPRIHLDRDHVARAASKLERQRSCTRADIQDQV